ncbi:glycoside hydrolase family 2 protein [Clostridium thermarum]|uniref:glycoside hydrolase family 2 protein n=1 Tax=Clostridium thermarum TaxID=1716543 RepID=UPI0013D5FA19|nr:sugar-binding domain-containing protein [Clostridium thermarum]
MEKVLNSNYPRRDFMRDIWLDLQGQWEFEFDDENLGVEQEWYDEHSFSRSINVPYVYQSELSEINIKERHDIIWYKRTFTCGENFKGKRIFINFGAVDFYSKLWINGKYIGSHSGGYTPFKFDISQYVDVDKENTIVLRVEDDSKAKEQPRGKQGWLKDNFGCWYTNFTGIWQPVWLTAVGKTYIEDFKLTPDIDNQKVNVKVLLDEVKDGTSLKISIKFKDIYINEVLLPVKMTRLEVDINIFNGIFENGIMYWSVNDPNLYDITFTVIDDEVEVDKVYSYFGMRKVSIRAGRVLLNNLPVYQKLILDQGYFPGGFISPKDEQALIEDIKLIKEMGFNGVRKHEKIEDPRFLYWCDKLGLLVWEEMPSPYIFNERAIKNVTDEWQRVIDRDYNHPCIITWVLYNESWGVYDVCRSIEQQNYLKSLYYLTKAIDKTRPVIDNDGWEHAETDILTIHDYVGSGNELKKTYSDMDKVLNGIPSRLFPRFMQAEGVSYKGQPIILSEYGGIAFDTASGWGYNQKAKSADEFIERYKSLTNAIKEIDYICGYCYTQLTDVEQEQNGLLTIDRVPKIELSIIKEINDL